LLSLPSSFVSLSFVLSSGFRLFFFSISFINFILHIYPPSLPFDITPLL
jgi:hypothetical protein